MVQFLQSEVTRKEISEALSMIRDHYAPGNDELSSYFFKVAWNFVGDDIIRAVENFFPSGRMLREVITQIIHPCTPKLILFAITLSLGILLTT